MSNAYLRSPLWGGLFRDPEVERCFGAEAMLGHFVAFEMAWTEALVAQGIVEPEAGARARAALDGFVPDAAALEAAVERDGLPWPELVRQARAGLGEGAAKALHTGATSQDVLDTSLVLAMRELLHAFGSRLDSLLERLDALKRRHGDRPLMGRTRMQAALPITVSDRIGDWSSPLAGLRAELDAVIDGISLLQAGGPVGLGAHDAGFREHVARTLNLRAAEIWHTDRRGVLDVGHWLTKVTGVLGKMGQDIALMSQQGVDELRLDGGGASSAMPHKQNPVRAELLVAFARVMAGEQGGLAQALVHEQERSGVAMAIEWMLLPRMFETAGAALTTAGLLAGQIRSLGDAVAP